MARGRVQLHDQVVVHEPTFCPFEACQQRVKRCWQDCTQQVLQRVSAKLQDLTLSSFQECLPFQPPACWHILAGQHAKLVHQRDLAQLEKHQRHSERLAVRNKQGAKCDGDAELPQGLMTEVTLHLKMVPGPQLAEIRREVCTSLQRSSIPFPCWKDCTMVWIKHSLQSRLDLGVPFVRIGCRSGSYICCCKNWTLMCNKYSVLCGLDVNVEVSRRRMAAVAKYSWCLGLDHGRSEGFHRAYKHVDSYMLCLA